MTNNRVGTILKRLRTSWLCSSIRLRWLQLTRWWLRGNRRYGLWWRLGNGLAAVLILLAAVIPMLQQLSTNDSYKLSADALKLVGQTDPTLTKQLSYDANSQTYQFNKDAIKPVDSNPLTNLKSQVGRATGKGTNKSLYALDVPQQMSNGVTYHDINSGLSFSLVPQFSASNGRDVNGHLVYPLHGGNQAVYTLKNNGLKEDIVVPKVSSDSMTFSYSLHLPDTLAAKVIPGSNGAIGIYSADPALFGNISYGNDADRAVVEKARVRGDKTYLVFGLPSPVIKDTRGNSVGSARFQLDATQLSVVASGLLGISTPITIDPSVVVTSTGDFQTGNVEDNIDFSTTGQITRGGLTGGSVNAANGGWASAGSSFTTPRFGAASVAYNGYLYVLGGCGTNAALTTCSSYQNDVQYIAINASTGALTGSWAAAGSSFTTARFGLSATVYDGYLYILGGSSGSYQNDVQYIAINASTGALTGSWAAAGNNFTNARYYSSASVYNGYLYVAGGYDGSTFYNDVQYAPINANGTIGSFASAGNSFTTGRYGLAAVTYNNNLYIIGGCSAGACSTYKADVQYAPINANGTIGNFNTTTSFNTGRYDLSATVYNGYIYIMAGYGGAYQSDTQYAPINANGSLGAWATNGGTTFTTGRAAASATSYNGYLYLLAGTNSTTQNDTQYAKIDVAGTTNAYATTTSLATPTITAGQILTYANHIYMIGGNTNGANATTTINAASLNADGTVGTWSTTGMTALGTATDLTGAVAYNGFVYVVAGATNPSGTTAQAIVQYAAINASTGAIGSWSTTTSYAISGTVTPAYGHAPVAYNGYLYYRGSGGGGSTSISYALICTGSNSGVGGCSSTAGSLGTWNTPNPGTTSLKTARTFSGMVAYNGFMYVVGGNDISTNPLASVEYSPISSTDGSLGIWHYTHDSTGTDTTYSAGTGLVTARARHGTFIINGYMYVVAGIGASSTDLASVESARINADGTLGTWTLNTSLPATVSSGQFATYNGYIYSVSGKVNGSRSSTVYYAYANNGGSGATGNWASNATSISGAYASGWSGGGMFAAGGYLYLMGGYNGSSVLATTYSAPINSDGTVGSWTARSTMNAARYNFATAVYNGYVYVYTGTGSGGDLNTYEYAQITSGGTLGSWSSDTTMNTGAGSVSARTSVGGSVYNGYLYVLGGIHSGTSYTDVYYAPLNLSNGSVGTWVVTTAFTNARNSLASFAYNGYVYVIGGLDGSGNYLADIQYAPLSSGAVGTWITSTTQLIQPRALMQATASNGFVYIFSGNNTAGTLTDTEFAPIGSGGVLGTWQQSPGTAFSTSRNTAGATIYNGVLYMAGGLHTATYQTDLQYVPLSSMARVGHYSKLVDLGGSTNVTSIGANGTLPTGAGAITYRAAGTNATFGSSALASGVSGSGACVGTTTATRYIWVSVALDDSLGLGSAGIFPDILGSTSGSGISNAALTDFTINYTTTHPAPNIRLRTGQTLQLGNLSALDTCGA